jgi:hypothetical protein
MDSYITSYLFAQGSLITLMMEAARTFETSVIIYLNTRQYIPEDSELHTRRRENLKSHVSRQVSPLFATRYLLKRQQRTLVD